MTTLIAFGLMAGVAESTSQTVGVGAGAFNPQTVTIDAGDTVTWRWNGPDTDYGIQSDPSAPEQFSAPAQHNVGDTYSYTFVNPGTYGYSDPVHAIRGVVVVQSANAPPPTGDVTEPKVSGFRATPSHFCRRASRNKICKGPGGTKLRFNLTESAAVGISAVRLKPRKITSFELGRGKAGANVKRFTAKRLVPGKYRIDLIATDNSGNESRVARTRLTVLDATSRGTR
jgi:plastocyanin